MKEKSKVMADLLKVLANEYRLMILCYLMEAPLSAGKLWERMPQITQSALSQHLSLLKAHGILSSTKSGQSVTYEIADDRVREIINTLKKHYCEETVS